MLLNYQSLKYSRKNWRLKVMKNIKAKLTTISLGIILTGGIVLANNNINNTNNVVCVNAAASWTIDAWMSYWNTFISQACEDTNADNKESLEEFWTGEGMLSDGFKALSAADQETLKNAEYSDVTYGSFAQTYDHIILRYGLEDFVGRVSTTQKSYNVINTSNTNTEIYIVTAVAIIGLTSIAGFYLVHKNKQEN